MSVSLCFVQAKETPNKKVGGFSFDLHFRFIQRIKTKDRLRGQLQNELQPVVTHLERPVGAHSATHLQTGDMKRLPGNGIEGAMVCISLGSMLRPLFYFLDDVSYPQSVVVDHLVQG